MRFNEFKILIENHAGKVGKMKRDIPSLAPGTPGEAELDKRVVWAEATLVKAQAILWYVTLVEYAIRASLNDESSSIAQQEFNKMWGEGNYAQTNLDQLQATLDHFFASEYSKSQAMQNVRNAIRPTTTTVNALIANATAAEEKIHKENEAKNKLAGRPDIELLPGDKPVVPSGNYTWWHLPHNSHPPESKAMGHCGNCFNSDDNLLSLRTNAKPIWPVLTFEWNPNDHVLWQTKGPKNSKPSKSFHPHIMTLLLSGMISGIARQSYQPASDFSLFDLSRENLKIIEDYNKQLILDQISKYPIDFLRAPENIRADPTYREFAVRQQYGLSALIHEDGTIDTSESAWENAIKTDEKLIIYSPPTLKNWKERVTNYLSYNIYDLGYCSGTIRSDYEIMSPLINERASVIEMVPLRAESYDQLALEAVLNECSIITAIPAERRTFEMCTALADGFVRSSWNYDLNELLKIMDINRFDKNQQQELVTKMLPEDRAGVLFDFIPDDEKTPDLVTDILRKVRIHGNISIEERAERTNHIFQNTPKKNFSNYEYMDFCIQVARISPDSIPLELQNEEYLGSYVIWMEDTEENVDRLLQSEAFNKLDTGGQFNILTRVGALNNGFDKVVHFFEPDLHRYLRFMNRIISAGGSKSHILDHYSNYVNEHMTEIENDEKYVDLLISSYKTLIQFDKALLIDLPMPANTPASTYRNLISHMKTGECENLLAVPDWVVAKNKKWFIKEVIENITHDDANGVDKLYRGLANYSNAEEMYLEIFENFENYFEEIVGKLSIDSLAKTGFLYEFDPEIMKDAFVYKLQEEPGLLDEATIAFPKIFTEDDVEWIQPYFREAVRKYFMARRPNSTIFDRMNLNMLSPKVFSFAIELWHGGLNANAYNNASPEDTRMFEKVYNWAKDKPEYRSAFDRLAPYDIFDDFNFTPDTEEIDDTNTYEYDDDFIDPRDL